MALVADKMIHCRIHTPDGTVCDEQAVGVQLPASDGYMGILPNRAPVTAVVATGMITLTRTKGEPIELFVSRGFLQVNQNELTVMAEECTPVESLDAEHAWELLQRAYKLPQDTQEQRSLRDQAVDSGRIRFALAQRGRKKQQLDEPDFQSLMR
jgi:F-type H+-transporting ATPase subunit epsilon